MFFANKLDYLVQYKAWCLNNGNHYTRLRGAADWNGKIIWKMRTELAIQWEIVEEEIPQLFSALSDSVRQILGDLKRTILGASEKPPSCLLAGSNRDLQTFAKAAPAG